MPTAIQCSMRSEIAMKSAPKAHEAIEPTTQARATLRVEALTVDVTVEGEAVRIVDGIDFAIGPGEHVALVGESGSGKSMTARAIMRLDRQASLGGRLTFEGQDLLALSEPAMNRYRGSSIGMVFQDPMASLDPLMSIGNQVAETLRIRGVPRKAAKARAVAMLRELGVHQAAERFASYPHEFSGGMRQRVVLAMALVGEPRLLIADEPTTALDVRVQEQVLDVLDEISQRQKLAVLLITHDLGIVAGFADRVLVMYAGRIVEEGPVERIFANPLHPYTKGLIAAIPRADRSVDRLSAIPGAPPPPRARPPGCAFHPRCAQRMERCTKDAPGILRLEESRRVACHLYDPNGEER